MHIFIDTANLEEIREVHSFGILAGVTTNPTLVARENVSFHERVRAITEIVSGPVSAEVIAQGAEGMVTEGLALAAIAPNVTIKVPMTFEGLKAVHILAEKGIKTNVTLIFTANQALLAARAGATYVSPFVGRLDDIGDSGLGLIASISEIFMMHQIGTQIISASIRSVQQVSESALAGADIATIPYKIIKQMAQHPLTDQGIERFLADWEAVKDLSK